MVGLLLYPLELSRLSCSSPTVQLSYSSQTILHSNYTRYPPDSQISFQQQNRARKHAPKRASYTIRHRTMIEDNCRGCYNIIQQGLRCMGSKAFRSFRVERYPEVGISNYYRVYLPTKTKSSLHDGTTWYLTLE